MKTLKSSKFSLPEVYFITDRKEIKDIPVGVPFIYGDEDMEEHIIRMLEYETLYVNALKTGLPFKFKEILRDNGYGDLKDFYYHHPIYTNEESKKDISDLEGLGSGETEIKEVSCSSIRFKQYVKDTAAYVDLEILRNLKIYPEWLSSIEKSVEVNTYNFIAYDSNMYNKKLGGMYGDISFSEPEKNVIIIDISGSIPKAVSSTILALAKNLAQNFYADLLITGSKSTLYDYSEIQDLDIGSLYVENGEDNDQTYFKRLVTTSDKKYKTAIVFGDNHHPGYAWRNKHNQSTCSISDEEGKKLCKWTVKNIISLHTGTKSSTTYTAGYARWFNVEEDKIEHIKNWVKYLEKI